LNGSPKLIPVDAAARVTSTAATGGITSVMLPQSITATVEPSQGRAE
jgi:hypothetical protein